MRPRHNGRGNGASETPRNIRGCERIREGSRNRGLTFPMRAGSAANASAGTHSFTISNINAVRFAMDSPLEGDGFELPVPREMTTIFEPSCFWFL